MYNNFGLTYVDIVNSFKGAITSDFGSQAIIETEMELAESMIVNKLSSKALNLLDSIEYMEVPTVPSISGSYQFTLDPAYLSDLYVFAVEYYNPALNNTFSNPVPSLCGCNSTCSNSKKTLDSSYLYSDYTLANGVITFGSSFNQLTHHYYVSYKVDKDNLNLPSLKGLMRDLVCCTMGQQLYSRGEDTWSLVNTYCERGDKWLELLDEHWLPSELKSKKWLNSPITIRGGITSIKIARS